MPHMAPLRISSLIRSVYDLLPSNANQVRRGKKEDPTKSAMLRQTDHRACLELFKNHPKTNTLIFTREGGAKFWHGRSVRTTNQRKCLLDDCDNWDVSADLPEWVSHRSIIKETKLRSDIVFHSASTRQ